MKMLDLMEGIDGLSAAELVFKFWEPADTLGIAQARRKVRREVEFDLFGAVGKENWVDCTKITLGVRGPGTSDCMLRTLRSLVKFNWLLISNNILGTFQM